MKTDYLKLFRAMPYTSIVFSTDYIIVEATDLYLEMTKRTRNELVGKNVFNAFPDNPGDKSSNNSDILKKSIDKAIQTKVTDVMELLRYDIPIPNDQGDGFVTKYWDVSHTPVFNDAGEILYVIQKTGDATDRILTQKELTDTKEQVAFIAEAMPQLIWLNDKDGNLIYLNHRWEEYSGIWHEELMKDVWKKLVHPDDVEKAKKSWENAVNEKESYQAQTRLKSKEGTYRWFLSRAIPKRDEEGNVTLWAGSATDIHDTKILVDELLESNERLSELSDKVKESYEKAENERKTLERLIMEAPAMICIQKGPNHVYELANPIYEMALPGRKLIGRSCAEVIPEAAEQGFIKLLDSVYNEGKTIVGKEMLLPLDRKGNGIMEDAYFTFTYQPLYERNKVIGIVTFAFEVTDTVKLKKKLQDIELN